MAISPYLLIFGYGFSGMGIGLVIVQTHWKNWFELVGEDLGERVCFEASTLLA